MRACCDIRANNPSRKRQGEKEIGFGCEENQSNIKSSSCLPAYLLFFISPSSIDLYLSQPTHLPTYLLVVYLFSRFPQISVWRARTKKNFQRTRKYNLVALLLSLLTLIFPSSRLGWLAYSNSTLLRLGCSLDLPFISALWPNRYLIFLRLIGIIASWDLLQRTPTHLGGLPHIFCAVISLDASGTSWKEKKKTYQLEATIL